MLRVLAFVCLTALPIAAAAQSDIDIPLGTNADLNGQLQAAAARGAVRKGVNGDIIRQLQRFLRGAGYAAPLNGRFDNETEAQLKTFQLDHGLKGLGVFGPKTYTLISDYKPSNAVVSQLQSYTSGNSIQPGFEGRQVREMQQRLQVLGHDVDITGVYDAKTVAVIKSIQVANGVRASGIFGPKSYALLVSKEREAAANSASETEEPVEPELPAAPETPTEEPKPAEQAPPFEFPKLPEASPWKNELQSDTATDLQRLLTGESQVGSVLTLDQLKSTIAAAAKRWNVKPELLAAFLSNRSGFQTNLRGRANEVGLGQLSRLQLVEARRIAQSEDAKARFAGVPRLHYELYNLSSRNAQTPLVNIEASAILLHEQIRRFGTSEAGLAALAHGPVAAARVKREGLDQSRNRGTISKSTADFISQVMNQARTWKSKFATAESRGLAGSIPLPANGD